MRRIATVLLTSTTIAIAGAGATAWASAQPATATATATTSTPSSGPTNSAMTAVPVVVARPGKVKVMGSGCIADTSVVLSVGTDRRNVSTIAAGKNGDFRAVVTISAATPPGPVTLWAACRAPNPTGKLLNKALIKVTG